jgi:hypothetical protein
MISKSPHAPISCASRRRLARWLVGSPIRDIERDLILETLTSTHGALRLACSAYRSGLCAIRSPNIPRKAWMFRGAKAALLRTTAKRNSIRARSSMGLPPALTSNASFTSAIAGFALRKFGHVPALLTDCPRSPPAFVTSFFL